MIYRLKRLDSTLEKIFFLTPSEISHYLTIPLSKATTIYHHLRNEKIEIEIERDEKCSRIVTIFDKHYPKQLKLINDAPLVLYTLGDITLLNHSPSISVIGTRTPSNEAPAKLDKIVTPLIKNQWIIVSGLAYGVDSLAHRLTLHHYGKTIAVLGSGFHHIYPKKNETLCSDIVRTGVVISEYPPNVSARKYHFPERNRIISGLSMATLVIEATEKSGTLITVDQALDQGREVYAVPGSPMSVQSVGCHKLIQDGAKLVMCANDILEDWK